MARKIRILYVLSEFMYGSKVRQVCDLTRGLDKKLFEVEICGLDVGDEATGEIQSLGVPYFRLALHPPRSANLAAVGRFLKSPLTLRHGNYDIVHSLLYQSIFTEPLIVKLFTNAKYVYTKTNLEWDNHPLNWRLKSKLADRIISISRATDELLTEKGFGKKITKIFLGLDVDYFREDPAKRKAMREKLGIPMDAFVFGCAAQFVEWKDHRSLLRAFGSLSGNHSDTYLLLCGPNHNDGFFTQILDEIREHPANGRILMLGTLQDMPEFYSAIDCFVLPSWNEPFGYVYIEAMSCGKPVIACRAGGPLDIVEDGKSGRLCQLNNSADLSDKMMTYLSERSSAREHGKRGRERVVELYSTTWMVRNHEAEYEELQTGISKG